MKKAAIRRVIIYMLVFSLTFTSVSAAVVRPVEVQASAGVMEGWEVFIGILSSLGFFASNSSAGQTYYDQFINYISGTSDFGVSVYSMFSSLPDDLVNNGVDQATAKQMCTCLANALINIFDRNLLTGDNDFNSSYEYRVNGNVVGTISIELNNGHLKMVETFSDIKYLIVFECDPKKFVKNQKLSFTLAEGKIQLVDKEAVEETIKTYSLNLVNFLKTVVFDWINAKTKVFSKNKIFVENDMLSLPTPVDSTFSEQVSLKSKLTTQLLLLSHNFYEAYGLGDLASVAATKFTALSDGYINAVMNMSRYKVPDSYLMTIMCEFQEPSIAFYFTEDLSNYSLVFNGSNMNKVDSSGAFSLINNYGVAAYLGKSDAAVFNCTKLQSAFDFKAIPFEDYIDINDTCYFYYIVDFDMANYYSSIANYEKKISFLDEAKDYLIYGATDYASNVDSDVYVPDAGTYDDIVNGIENASTSEELDSALNAAQEANVKASETVKDEANSSGSSSTASDILQKILDAIIAVNNSVTTRLPLDLSSIISSFAGTADVIGDIDKLLNQKLPVIGSMADVVSGSLPSINDIKDWAEKVATPSIDSIADSGKQALIAIDNLGDKVVDAVAPISILDKLDGTIDNLAQDNAKLLDNVEKVINGEKTLTVSVSSSEPEPNDEDDFNLPVFSWLWLLFTILSQILKLFYHCLRFLFVIHSVEAYPYFIEDTEIIDGLNFMKSICIKGNLINVSLYDFLFFLVRIVLLFSIIKVIRKVVEKLN